MIEKAYDLMQKGRVECISEETYNIIGDHGTYTVAHKINGTVNCNCPGFISRKRCSHSLAVLMLTQPAILKSIKEQIRKKQ
jgi:hypothetical protein